MYRDLSCNPYRATSTTPIPISIHDEDSDVSSISLEEESNLSVSPISTSSYQFRANVCPILARAINVPEYKCEDLYPYHPPKSHGLDNCNVIIPSYYVKSYNQDIDYFTMIKDDIKNYRPLNEYQLEYIKDMSHEDKNEIIRLFNQVLTTFIDSVIYP